MKMAARWIRWRDMVEAAGGRGSDGRRGNSNESRRAGDCARAGKSASENRTDSEGKMETSRTPFAVCASAQSSEPVAHLTQRRCAVSLGGAVARYGPEKGLTGNVLRIVPFAVVA